MVTVKDLLQDDLIYEEDSKYPQPQSVPEK